MIRVSTSYVIISPVRDEANHIEKTIRSVIAQTLKPLLWIIVDDGSMDHTPEIISRYAQDHLFIKLVRTRQPGVRQPGSGVIRAFNYGYADLKGISYDYIVKLDGDLSFDADYFEKLFQRFHIDSRVGIASGIYLEQGRTGVWEEVKMPYYHAAGACKVLRRECFKQIDGFIATAGWDTVDEMRAMAKGWRTGHFSDLRMRHHKPEGSGIGMMRTSLMHGEIYYLTSGNKLFFLFKLIHRIGSKPYLLGSLALLAGYLRAAVMRKQCLLTKEEASIYHTLLRERLWTQAKSLASGLIL
ncbi:glycosyltransferase [Nitrospira sp. BLG_1]|uniref:glycosyltransferase n=1 Tax=Nitrospira sp. BLG_1 TaxID=3395883 RepID=UPI0039BC6087